MRHPGRRWSSPIVGTLNVAAAVVISLAAVGCGQESDPLQPDPIARKAGTPAHCQLLVGSDGLASRALAFAAPIVTSEPDGGHELGSNPEAATPLDRERHEVQEALFEIVVTGDKKLANPVGQLVDFLDDPAAYLADDNLMAKVERAGAKVRKVCTRP